MKYVPNHLTEDNKSSQARLFLILITGLSYSIIKCPIQSQWVCLFWEGFVLTLVGIGSGPKSTFDNIKG